MACKGFDEQVVRLDKGIADLAKQFVLVRITNMRGVDLSRFDFDYDLTWAGFFMNAEGHTYGRFGGRDAGDPEKHLTPPALKLAMQRALAAYRKAPDAPPQSTGPRVVAEDYPASKRLKPDACIHCHQVYDFRREALRQQGKWTNAQAFVYPLPRTLGFETELDRPDVVKSVTAGSAAERAGLRAVDTVTRVGGKTVASFLDLLYALEKAPETGELEIQAKRGTAQKTLRVALEPGWRKYDISWRASMWGMEPTASVYGEDLTADEKRALGIDPQSVAFRQGDWVPPAASRGGVRAKDIILGIVGEEQATRGMTMLQFNLYVRLNHQPGDRVVYGVIRNGKRMEVPVTLAERD